MTKLFQDSKDRITLDYLLEMSTNMHDDRRAVGRSRWATRIRGFWIPSSHLEISSFSLLVWDALSPHNWKWKHKIYSKSATENSPTLIFK